MHEIIELEKRWLRYKFKKWIMPLSLTGILSVATLLYIFVDFSNLNLFVNTQQTLTQTLQEESKDSSNENQTHASNEIKQTQESQKPLQNKQLVIQAYEPVIEFSQPQNQKSDAVAKETEPEAPSTPSTTQKAQIPQTPKPNETESKEESSATFARSQTQMDPQTIEQRFNETNNVRHAIFLAKYYYNNKEYEKSYKWAFTVNQLDPINEEGWLFFAKSLYKLDKKDDAVTVLRNYLNHYRSKDAQDTLRKIIQGVL